MVLCEMCGKVEGSLIAEIEGAELKVCSLCARYGKVKRKLASVSSISPIVAPKMEKPEFKVVDNFSSWLRSARESSGLTQEDFANFLQEKQGIVAKWEQGILKPSIEVAVRLGKLLKINLVEKEEIPAVATEVIKKKSGDELTFGDFVKVRKRKN